MRIAIRWAGLAFALALAACASNGSSSDRDRRDSGEYYRGDTIHSNSFPETFGGGGPEAIGRPERQRFLQ